MTYLDLPPAYFWRFLVIGYFLTIAIETPILVVGLARGHSLARRLLAGVWLTACTYPIVVLVLPLVVPRLFADPQHGEWAYLAVAETFAPLAECALFTMLVKREASSVTISLEEVAIASSDAPKTLHDYPYRSPQAQSKADAATSTRTSATWQDYAAIIAANLASFLGGEWLLKNVAWLKNLIALD